MFPKLTSTQARQGGFVPLAGPYVIGDPSETMLIEGLWLQNVRNDLMGCHCCQVETSDGIEIWRHSSEMDIDPTTGVKHAFKTPITPCPTS